ncbi:hypothetical protein ACJZ2D_000788 [Fusarium nematophilum]
MDQQDISVKQEVDRETIGADDSRRKACGQCRARKIRCDKQIPCSNCRVANRRCTEADLLPQPRKPRQRVLISSQYETKIDHIEARLLNIEGLLRDLSQRSASTPTSSPQQPTTPQQGLASGSRARSASITFSTPAVETYDPEDELVFGRDDVIVDQTTGATEDLEHAISSITIDNADPELHDALSNLRILVELQNRQSAGSKPRFPLQQQLPAGGLAQLPLPPVNIVVALLKYAKASPPGLFTLVCSYVGIQDFTTLCQKVYFPTEDMSDTIYTIVMTLLYYLFLEQQTITSFKATKEELASYIHLCQTNLETALANMSLFMSPKVETVQALLLGTLYAVDVSRPTVAWFLNSAAANICHIAGFHRYNESISETPAGKLRSTLFWQIYTNDKALALRLHRAPMTQDYDISIPRIVHFEGPMSFEMSGVVLMWVRLATLQGQVYEKLYSPAALALPQSDLAERARILGAECGQLELESAHHRTRMASLLEGTATSSLLQVHVKGDEVQLLSIKTLIYRALPPPTGSGSRFSVECVDAARSAMQQHLECMTTINSDIAIKSIYVHWHLALTHFAPFFVIFSYVIETLSIEDLQLLNAFGASLEACAESSETVQKLWRLCEVFGRITRLYVDVKARQRENQFKVLGDRFDAYLDQLGLVSMEREGEVDMGGANLPAFDDFQAADLANWISGSQNLLGLVEQDAINFTGL